MKYPATWKSNERIAAKYLKGKRISRGSNFGQSLPDIYLDEFPNLKIDHKRRKRFIGRTLLEEVKKRYCKSETDIPVVIVKEHKQKGAMVLVELRFLARILDHFRSCRNSWEEICKNKVEGKGV